MFRLTKNFNDKKGRYFSMKIKNESTIDSHPKKEPLGPGLKLLKVMIIISLIITLIGIIFFFWTVYLQYYHEDIFNQFFVSAGPGKARNWLQHLAIVIFLEGFLFSEMFIILFYMGRKMNPFTSSLKLFRITLIITLIISNLVLIYYNALLWFNLRNPELPSNVILWTSFSFFMIFIGCFGLYRILKYIKFK